jgi:hypothetical protein
VNGILEVGEGILDISDFSDGIKLVHFLERIVGRNMGQRLEIEKKMTIHKIHNCHLALQFASEVMDVCTAGVTAEGV